MSNDLTKSVLSVVAEVKLQQIQKQEDAAFDALVNHLDQAQAQSLKATLYDA